MGLSVSVSVEVGRGGPETEDIGDDDGPTRMYLLNQHRDPTVLAYYPRSFYSLSRPTPVERTPVCGRSLSLRSPPHTSPHLLYPPYRVGPAM